MLLYTSGAALALHLRLAHSPVSHATVSVDTDTDTHHDHHRSPAKPAKHNCPICDMLTGITKPLAIDAPAQPLLTLAQTRAERASDRVVVSHVTSPDISRRGPPAVI